ncbi:helix-turn-helix domain-containing protein [Streptomyces sp. KHY 26]|uniref:helix-turn-helix domain-containing protein n=1 Tax=Streptomyces sp. KHY 26 TaxID=3097359 RepID=UPI00376ECEE4
MRAEDDFTRRAGALLRAAANDLKRDDENAERELGLEKGTFAEYCAGTRPVTWELMRRAAEVWPLDERDLLPGHDDCPAGVRVMRHEESRAGGRVLSRGGEPYYEYRDTAMSRIASYRPEWIRMLRVVEDDDPDNPLVQWNRGHLLYQFTYFIGPVNYYYRWNGVSACVPMDTGDSVWGLPFAPHSFTSRSATEPACILALTYGGSLLGDAQRELAVLGNATTRALAIPLDEHARRPGAMIRSFMDAGAVTVAELADRTGLSPERAGELAEGATHPDTKELDLLAHALGVSVRDLLPPRTETAGGISLQHARDARSWVWPGEDAPAYRITRLAGDPLHPHTSALQVDVLASAAGRSAPLTTYQHQYLYVLGDQPVTMCWEFAGRQAEETLTPGDSAYVRPQVPITFAATGEGGRPRVLLLRISGSVTPEVRYAVGTMAPGGVDRYVAEDRLWYS